MSDYRKLIAYQKAFKIAMPIFTLQNHYLKRKFMPFRIKSEDLQDQFVQILLKDIGKDRIQNILFLNLRMRIWKIQKPLYGLNFAFTVVI